MMLEDLHIQTKRALYILAAFSDMLRKHYVGRRTGVGTPLRQWKVEWAELDAATLGGNLEIINKDRTLIEAYISTVLCLIWFL